MKKRMMKICYMMTLAAVLCTSGTNLYMQRKMKYREEQQLQMEF